MGELILFLLILIPVVYFYYRSITCKHCGSDKDVVNRVCGKCWQSSDERIK